MTLLGVFFLAVGLEDADRFGSVVAALSSVAGLALSASALVRRPRRGTGPEEAPRSEPGQRVEAAVIGGDSVQIRNVTGDVRVGLGPPARTAHTPARPSADAAPPPPDGGQSLSGSRVGGSSFQIDQVGGSVNISRGDHG